MKTYRHKTMLIALGLAAFWIAEDITAQDSEQGAKARSSAEITTAYDQMEADLMARFRAQLASNDAKLSTTIKALGHIRSRTALPLLLANLTVVPGEKTESVGGFEPVRIVGANTPESQYVALRAVQDIGLPLDDCVSEIEKAKEGSLRQLLVARIGYLCHGRSFIQLAREREKAGDEKWKRVLDLVAEK